jgi:site-specific recombinase
MNMFGVEWYVISIVCFVLYVVTAYHAHPLLVDRHSLFGMAMVSLVPILNVVIAGLWLFITVRITCHDVRSAVRED